MICQNTLQNLKSRGHIHPEKTESETNLLQNWIFTESDVLNCTKMGAKLDFVLSCSILWTNCLPRTKYEGLSRNRRPKILTIITKNVRLFHHRAAPYVATYVFIMSKYSRGDGAINSSLLDNDKKCLCKINGKLFVQQVYSYYCNLMNKLKINFGSKKMLQYYIPRLCTGVGSKSRTSPGPIESADQKPKIY